MKERFLPASQTMQARRLTTVATANGIISDYKAMGFSLTLRQLYYQFVSRDLIPNTIREYKKLGDLINTGRLMGLIDWDAIEDRTRNVKTINCWDDPQELLDASAAQYKEDLWATQDAHVEVWIEKDALTGIIEPICKELRLPYLACRGYLSQSEQYAAGKRLGKLARQGKTPIILHLGDHDPSGMDMTRDNQERLSMFARAHVEVRRLALNMDQVDQYGPPPNPAKDTDSRSDAYVAEFGDSSWELDALDPPVIAALIRDEVDGIVDLPAWNDAVDAEQTNRETLENVRDRWPELRDNWDDVAHFMDELTDPDRIQEED
jgi:hypothetical protein